MNQLIGEASINAEALEQMRKSGGTWAAYQNHDMSSSGIGDLRFLKVGPGCTFMEAPNKYPDSHLGIGWRYLHVGFVNLETGSINDSQSQ
jgi:hypothetical protein